MRPTWARMAWWRSAQARIDALPARLAARANVPPHVRHDPRAADAYLASWIGAVVAACFGGAALIMTVAFPHLPWQAGHIYVEYAFLGFLLWIWMRSVLHRRSIDYKVPGS